MSIYIISNREVTTGQNGKEIFNENGKEHALPIFRIAKCKLKPGMKKATYDIIADDFPEHYQSVLDVLDTEIKQNGDSETPPPQNTEDEVSRDNKITAKDLHGSSKLFYDLYKGMMHNPLTPNKKCDTLIFIHGAATSMNETLEHIVKLHELYMGENSPISHLLYISWPSRRHEFLTYWNDQRDARVTGVVLARIYEKLLLCLRQLFEQGRHKPCGSKIHLAAHSMGNQVLKSMLQSLPEESIKNVFGEIVLLHPDVEDTVFEDGKPFTLLEHLAERTHIYVHHSDDALLLSRYTKNFSKRLGKKGPSNIKTLNNETFVVNGTKLEKPGSLREALWDHWGYLERSVEVEDIINVFKGIDAFSFPKRHQKGNLNCFDLRE